MKNLIFNQVHIFLTCMAFLAFTSCQKEDISFYEEDDDFDLNTPLNADFNVNPQYGIIADKTDVSFSNYSSGQATTTRWQFGEGEGSSNLGSPSYQFDKEGIKTVQLTVSNAEGEDQKTMQLRVHAMDPNLHNYEATTTYSTDVINFMHNPNYLLIIGDLKFKNDYSSPVKVLLFDPADWLAGNYQPSMAWNFAAGQEAFLANSSGSKIDFTSDWGIQIEFDNGVKSCVRTLYNYVLPLFTFPVPDATYLPSAHWIYEGN